MVAKENLPHAGLNVFMYPRYESPCPNKGTFIIGFHSAAPDAACVVPVNRAVRTRATLQRSMRANRRLSRTTACDDPGLQRGIGDPPTLRALGPPRVNRVNFIMSAICRVSG